MYVTQSAASIPLSLGNSASVATFSTTTKCLEIEDIFELEQQALW